MKLVCHIEELQHHERWDEDRLAAETGIDKRTIEKIIKDSESWSLKRAQIERLMVLGYDRGLRMFSLHHNELWATFAGKTVFLFRGAPHADAKVEDQLSAYLKHRGGHPEVRMGVQDLPVVREAMTTTNCVFIGSPRANPASEVALSLLADPKARPFDGSPTNRGRFPVQMIGGDPIPGRASAVVVPEHDHGFSVRSSTGRPVAIDVNRVGPKEPVTSKSPAQDAAIVVACRAPLGTKTDVTTLIIMGYSGLATQAAARQLTHGYLPMHEDRLAAGEVHVFSYTFDFTKPKNASSTTTADLRQEKAETGRWAHLWSSNAARVGALLRDVRRKERQDR